MNQKQPASSPQVDLPLGDIYYVLFKRKWLILIFAICGFVAAGVVFETQHPSYQSSAELLIEYVAETKDPLRVNNNPAVEVNNLGQGGGILASEIQILRSFDSAKATAEILQPSKILEPYGGGTNEDAAAHIIMNNLGSEPLPGGQIIYLTFSHRDSTLVQPVLQQLITNYITREHEIRQKPGEYDAIFSRQQEMISGRLAETEAAMADAKNKAGVVDLTAAMADYQSQEGTVVRKISEDNFQLAELGATAAEIKKSLPASDQTNTVSTTNTVAPPSAKTLAAYGKIIQKVARLQADADRLGETYTPLDARVQTNQIDLKAAEDQQQQMEDANPGLLAVMPGKSGPTPAMEAQATYNAMIGRINVLKFSLEAEAQELQLIRSNGTNLVKLESTIRELDRKRNEDEAELQKVEASVRNSRLEADLAGRISNIDLIQNPTPPVRDLTKTPKIIAELAGGGIGLGLGLALLLELVLDRSFKRPHEVANRLKLPFFLAIPYLNGNSKLRLIEGGGKTKLLTASSDDPQPPAEADNNALAPAHDGPVAPWDEKHALRPFHETLRDRLIAYFEMLNLTHKPKLVAVTSCDIGAGVSTIASGLASSLSETGEGNVLLVNMNSEDGEAHHFYKGRLTLGIEDVLGKENRDTAMVQENLYVVKEMSNRDRLPSVLPKRFGHLVSKLKSSDYDYIIFDMPPITQISVTPRLARFMDTVLLVVEAEKTDRDVAQRATALLGESRVGVVMNKTRSYVPKRLLQEL